MTMNRRELIRTAALAVAGAQIASTAAADLHPDASALRSALEAQRNQIRTLHVRYRHLGDPQDRLTGPNEMAWNGRSYHIRHSGPNDPFFIIVHPQTTLTVLGEPQRVLRSKRSRTKRWPPAPSLDSFLPVPHNLPIVASQRKDAVGKVQVGLAQGEHGYWADPDLPAVVSHETFTNRGVLRLKEEYSNFQPTNIGLWFPRRIEISIFRPQGDFVRKAVVEVDDAHMNGEVDSSLFDMDRYRE